MTIAKTLAARVTAVANGEGSVESLFGAVVQLEGFSNLAKFEPHRFVIDEPVTFGGTGLAADPAQLLMAALGASLSVTLAARAALAGIPIQGIAVSLSGDIDVRGFFGLSTEVRAGLGGLTACVTVDSPCGEDKLKELFGEVLRCCPVLDNLERPTPSTIIFRHSGSEHGKDHD